MSRGPGLDGHAAEADDSQERYFRWLFSRLAVPANGRCLDIGCADPRVLGAFARTGRTPVGFSFDGLNSLTVRRLYPDAELADLDYDEAGAVYARAGATFDFMFCRGLGFAERLLDWREPGFVDATRALSQRLTPGGVLLWAQYPDRRLGLAEPIIGRRAVQGLLRHLELAGLRLLSFAPTSTVVTVLAVRPDYPFERASRLHQANARDWLSILRHVRATLDQVPIEEENAAPVDDATVLDALQAASAHLATLYLPRVTEQRLLIAGTDAVAQIYARAAESLGQRVVGFWSSIASEWNGSSMRHPIGWLPAALEEQPTAIVVADPTLASTVVRASLNIPVLNLWTLAPFVSDFRQSGWWGRPGFIDIPMETPQVAGAMRGFAAELLAARTAAVADQLQPPIVKSLPKSLKSELEIDQAPVIDPAPVVAYEPLVAAEPLIESESSVVDELIDVPIPLVPMEPFFEAESEVIEMPVVLLEPVFSIESTIESEPTVRQTLAAVASEPDITEESAIETESDTTEESVVALVPDITEEPSVVSEPVISAQEEESPSAFGSPSEIDSPDSHSFISSVEVRSDHESPSAVISNEAITLLAPPVIDPPFESTPVDTEDAPTSDNRTVDSASLEQDLGDVASLLRRTVGPGFVVGEGTVIRHGDVLQMVALGRLSTQIVLGPFDDFHMGRVGFSARIRRLSGTETECRVIIAAGDRRAIMVLGPSTVWVTDSPDLVAAVDVPETTGRKARLMALLWAITTGSPPVNRVKATTPMVPVSAAEWHHYGIQVRPDGIELWLDGTVVQCGELSGTQSGSASATPVTVQFGLWDNTLADSEVWWKDLRIAEDLAPMPRVIGGE